MTRVTAQNLARILDQVIDHRAHSDYLPLLNAVHLDAAATYLHAVATDRFTFAVARTEILAPETKHAATEWQHTIPARHIKVLRKFAKAVEDPATILTITPGDDTDALSISFDDGTLTVPTVPGKFPAWRQLIAGTLAKEQTNDLVGLNTSYAARWQSSTETNLHSWHTGTVSPVVFAGRDFIGLQMPANQADKKHTNDTVATEWATSLNGAAPVDISELTTPTAEETKQVRDFDEFLLRKVIICTDDAIHADTASSPAYYRTIDASVAAWSAYRLLEALRKADPVLTDKTLRDLEEELEGGEYSEWAWEYAHAQGHDPEKWTKAHRDWRAKLEARNAALEQPEQPEAAPASS